MFFSRHVTNLASLPKNQQNLLSKSAIGNTLLIETQKRMKYHISGIDGYILVYHDHTECANAYHKRKNPISGNFFKAWEGTQVARNTSATLKLNELVVYYWHFSNPGCLSDLWYQIDFQVIYIFESWTSYLALITMRKIDSQTDRIVSLWHCYLCSVIHGNFWLPRYVSTKHNNVYSRLICPVNWSFTELFCETY